MYYVISDSEGSTLDTFTDERAAEDALVELSRRHERSGETFFVLAYEDDGRPVGEARLVGDVLQQQLSGLLRQFEVDYGWLAPLVPSSAGEAPAVLPTLTAKASDGTNTTASELTFLGSSTG
jgi:hypothetical protein